jgi:periplasmic divalent cation tolerance protein
MNGTQVQMALMTAPSQEIAEQVVRALVDEGIVACGNILPGMVSIFRWEGEVQRETEVLVVFKTTFAEAPRLLARVPELHPYEVPELLLFPVVAGHGPYLDWVVESVGERFERERSQ